MEDARINRIASLSREKAVVGRMDAGTSRKLHEAAQEFESLFIDQMLQTMRRSMPEGGLLGAGSGQRTFREMLDQEMSRQIAHSGGLGVGELLWQQLVGSGQRSAVSSQQLQGGRIDESR